MEQIKKSNTCYHKWKKVYYRTYNLDNKKQPWKIIKDVYYCEKCLIMRKFKDE